MAKSLLKVILVGNENRDIVVSNWSWLQLYPSDWKIIQTWLYTVKLWRNCFIYSVNAHFLIHSFFVLISFFCSARLWQKQYKHRRVVWGLRKNYITSFGKFYKLRDFHVLSSAWNIQGITLLVLNLLRQSRLKNSDFIWQKSVYESNTLNSVLEINTTPLCIILWLKQTCSLNAW